MGSDKPEELSVKGDAVGGEAKSPKESIYDQIRVPIWVLDVIVALAVIGIGVCLYLGTR